MSGHDRIVRRLLAGAAVALSGAALLGGCSPAGDYRRPEVQLPASYQGAATAPADSGIASVPYRKFFAEPELRTLIDSAVVNNHDLLIAVKNMDYARQSLKAARLGQFPEVDLKGSATHLSSSEHSLKSSNSADLTTDEFFLSASASWEADIWAKIRNRRKSALAEYLRSTEAARAVRTRLVADVALGYWNLRMLDRQLEITRQNIALADTTLSMMRMQYDAGLLTSLALQQQESRLQSARLSVPRLESARQAQETALSILAGRMPGTGIARSAGFTRPAASDSLNAGVPLALLRNRPDVRAAEAALMSRHASMGAAKAMLYPSLTITAQGGLNSLQASDWFSTPGSLFGLVQGAVVQPLFRRGELKAEYERSKILRDEAEIAFRHSLLKAVGEVSDALVDVDRSSIQETIAAARVATLQKAVKDAKLLFSSGMATYVEVIMVEGDLLQAELELADVQRRRLSAVAELYRSVGGGWRD